MDIGRSEQVESELDAMIERRSRKKDPDEESEFWRKSVDEYNDKRQKIARLEWHAFHCDRPNATAAP